MLAPGSDARPQAPAAYNLSHTAAASQLSSTASGFKTCLNSPCASCRGCVFKACQELSARSDNNAARPPYVERHQAVLSIVKRGTQSHALRCCGARSPLLRTAVTTAPSLQLR